jgi:hypothetical protein
MGAPAIERLALAALKNPNVRIASALLVHAGAAGLGQGARVSRPTLEALTKHGLAVFKVGPSDRPAQWKYIATADAIELQPLILRWAKSGDAPPGTWALLESAGVLAAKAS